MKFIVEVRLNPGAKNQVVDAFELRGPNRSANVKFEKAWLGSRDDLAFVLVDSNEEASVVEACCNWNAFGKTQVYPVTDIEQF